ncbi:MAG: protein kinase [Deltaproteobacteria bacterium]|nr:protein kinase [Deltaproteobacteria bacterium]
MSLVVLDTGVGTSAQDLVGQVVDGRYRLERIVGRGGMGTVYACRHVVVGKEFAIKVLRSGVERSDEVLQRFVREAQAANAVKSRHICETLDFGQLPNGALYVVMELLDGTSLTRALRDETLSRRQLKHVFIQIAETLQRAHDCGIVHRDLKPDNVVLVRDEGDPLFVKLVDFGIAKMLQKDASDLTETGVILGTPYYMSPEQARGDLVDHRTDIYALGVMMFRAFTGKLPFVADTAMGVLTRHLTERPPLPSQITEMDLTTERLILRCLEKRPIDRFQSMADLAAALRSIPDESRRAVAVGSGHDARPRQATPTRVDRPNPRSFIDEPSASVESPSLPDPRASFTSAPDARASFTSAPSFVAVPDPRASNTSAPSLGTAHPSGTGRLALAGPPSRELRIGDEPPPPTTEPMPAIASGEHPTHRGVVSTRMAAKADTRDRARIVAAAVVLTLLGGGIAAYALREPTTSVPAAPSSSGDARAEEHPAGTGLAVSDPVAPIPTASQTASATALDDEPPPSTATARPSLPQGGRSPRPGASLGAPPSTSPPPPRSDEIRSPFD